MYERAVNLRDVGGAPTRHGAAVARRRLVRSETPELFSDADVERVLAEHAVTLVVDLRSPEQAPDGSGSLGDRVRRRVVDFVRLSGRGRPEGAAGEPEHWLVHQLDTVGPAWVAFLGELCSNTDGATLVHCHTGKDRTGILVALTLALVGVGDDDIVADYLRSAPVHEAMVRTFTEAGKWHADAPPFALAPASEAGMRRMLRELHRRWADLDAFVAAGGGAPDLADRVRAHLLAV
jgi:hypothetical protein